MKGNDLLEGIGKIDLALVREAEEENIENTLAATSLSKSKKAAEKRRERKVDMRILAIAASIVLLLGSIVGTGIRAIKREPLLEIEPESNIETWIIESGSNTSTGESGNGEEVFENVETEGETEEKTEGKTEEGNKGETEEETESKTEGDSGEEYGDVPRNEKTGLPEGSFLVVQSSDTEITVFDDAGSLLTSFEGVLTPERGERSFNSVVLSKGETIRIRHTEMSNSGLGYYKAGETDWHQVFPDDSNNDLTLLSDEVMAKWEVENDLAAESLCLLDGTVLETQKDGAMNGSYIVCGEYILSKDSTYDLSGKLLWKHSTFENGAYGIRMHVTELTDGRVLAELPAENGEAYGRYIIYDPKTNEEVPFEQVGKLGFGGYSGEVMLFFTAGGNRVFMDHTPKKLLDQESFLRKNPEITEKYGAQNVNELYRLNEEEWAVTTKEDGGMKIFIHICDNDFSVKTTYDCSYDGYEYEKVRLVSTLYMGVLTDAAEAGYPYQILVSDLRSDKTWSIPVRESSLLDLGFSEVDDLYSAKVLYKDGSYESFLMNRSGEILYSTTEGAIFYDIHKIDEETYSIIISSIASEGRQEEMFLDKEGKTISLHGDADDVYAVLYADTDTICVKYTEGAREGEIVVEKRGITD